MQPQLPQVRSSLGSNEERMRQAAWSAMKMGADSYAILLLGNEGDLPSNPLAELHVNVLKQSAGLCIQN